TRRVTPLPLYAVLLRVGFTEPAASPRPLVRSYRTVSPLPAACRERHARWRSALCCTFRGLAPPGSYPAPCPVEFGLSSAGSRRPRSPGRLGLRYAIERLVHDLVRARVVLAPDGPELDRFEASRRAAGRLVQRLQPGVLDAVLAEHLPHDELRVHEHAQPPDTVLHRGIETVQQRPVLGDVVRHRAQVLVARLDLAAIGIVQHVGARGGA